MVFSSVTFLLYFLPVFLVLYYALPCKNLVLTVSSFVFYGWGEPRFLPILFAYIVVNYFVGRRLMSSRFRRFYLFLGIALNVGLLAYFKYSNFLTAQFNALAYVAHWKLLPPTDILLPLGISFITFQGTSYIIDVFRGVAQAQTSLLSFAMYKSMFPQLIAGPIVRYSEIADQIEKRPLVLDQLYFGCRRFIIGLSQKVLIANIVAVPADQIFSLKAGELGTATAWVGILCYTLQIYFDFAGYFWRRWHMTLSRWFRDYLYIPLGGNRCSPGRVYLNLMIVFALCGIWHGANWTFLLWGLYHGFFLVIERLGLAGILLRLWRPVRHIYLIFFMMIGWVLFRAGTLHQAWAFISALLTMHASDALHPPLRYLMPSVALAMIVGSGLSVFPRPTVALISSIRGPSVAILSAAIDALLLCMLMLCVLSIASGSYNPFIYYHF